MDIRISGYRPVTIQNFGGQGGRAVAVTDARQGGPVPPVAPVAGTRPGLAELATQLRQTISSNGGYTDSIRGSNVNILA